MNRSTRRAALLAITALSATLAGCRGSGELVVSDGVGITAVRSACPAVGVPDYTGDITTFSSPEGRTAADIDVTATLSDVRSTCDEEGERIYSRADFAVFATRADPRGARSVQLPYYVVILRGGNTVVSKRVGTVTVQFADGAARAQAKGSGAAYINRADATLPDDIRDRITRRRKAGDTDAALDPMADPEVRAALQSANFELLVGFQLTQDQLAYNATR